MRDFHLPGRSTVFAQNGMCATSHPLAAKTAIDVLQAGGNAVDAATAAAILIGICEPQMTGLGGDMFALIKPAGSEDIVGLNASGRAPAGLSSAALRDAGHAEMPPYSAFSVTVPGAVDGFFRLVADHGTKPMAELLEPAIHYAENGVPVGPRTAFDWATAFDNLSGKALDLLSFDGKPPKPGQVWRAPGQAEALRKMAREGRAGFYEGEVAEDMVASLNALGGSHTLEDFAATKATYATPISGMYKGHELVELPPNGQGATAILMANILAQFDIAAMEPFGALRAHIEAEAAKLAYDARNRFIAEESPRLEHMLSQKTAEELAALIDTSRAMDAPSRVSEAVHKETIYLTVVDKNRMAVSLIYSVYHSFGSCLASDRFGIIFQNRGAGFTLSEGHPNEAAGGKRPMHTIIPAMLKKDGKVIMPFGVMGGAYQPNGHARVLTNIVDFGMHPQAALDAPRSFTDDGVMNVERGYSDAVRAELAAMGHKVEIPQTALGGAQAIWMGGDVLEGASDPRKDGCALGY